MYCFTVISVALSITDLAYGYLCDAENLCRCSYNDEYKKVVNCSGSKLQSIPNGLPVDGNIFDFNYNDIGYIKEDVFEDLTNAESLQLISNPIQYLPVGVFETMRNLKDLFLTSNAMIEISGAIFDTLGDLERLSLDATFIVTLPVNIFNNLRKLITLTLFYNEFESLQDGIFDSLGDLNLLDIKRNYLTTLPVGIFRNLENLQTLILTENKISTLVVGLFDSLKNLINLLISNNEIEILPIGLFDNLEQLQYLDIQDNKIRSIPNAESLFGKLVNVQIINLAYNLLVCDCTAKSLFYCGKKLYYDNYGDLYATCTTPDGQLSTVCSMYEEYFKNCRLTTEGTSTELTTMKRSVSNDRNMDISHSSGYELQRSDATKKASSWSESDSTSESIEATEKTTQRTLKPTPEGVVVASGIAVAGGIAGMMSLYGLAKMMTSKPVIPDLSKSDIKKPGFQTDLNPDTTNSTNSQSGDLNIENLEYI